MRLITWNCQGAFRKKADLILGLKPDILIVQECEHPDKFTFNPLIPKADATYWHGDNKHKGICIFTYNKYTVELNNNFNPKFRYILPFRVSGHGHSFTIFGIWAMSNKENYFERYIGQVWLAINHYQDLLGKSTILIGDFNSNKIWDAKDRVANHSDVVDNLESHNIKSLYHEHYRVKQGEETDPTFFLQRNIKKPYHIDYCFASVDILEKVKGIEIGKYENWAGYSDHVPMIIDFNL